MFDLNAIPEEYRRYAYYVPVFVFSFLVSIISTPIAGFISRKRKILGYPPSMREGRKSSDYRHLEKQPTPLLGGLAVILPFVAILFLSSSPSPQIEALIIGLIILTFMGIIDDMYDLPGYVQLIFQLVVALFLAFSVIDLTAIDNPFNGTLDLHQSEMVGEVLGFPLRFVFPGDIFLVLWILFCTLAVKVSGGTDGLMEGNVFISSIVFFLLSIRFLNPETALISTVLAGLILGFLFFNFYPAKIRSGSVGKSTYGLILAVLSVIVGAKFATAIIILLLPVIDLSIVIIGRIRDHKITNPVKILQISDQTHLHHRLLALGLSERQVAMSEYLITSVLGAVALIAAGTLKAAFAFVVIISATCGIIYVRSLSNRPSRKKPDKDETPEAKYSY